MDKQELWTPIIIISKKENGDLLVTLPNQTYCLTIENTNKDGDSKMKKLPEKVYNEILKQINNG